jgi:Transposase DDE domain
MKIQQDAFSKSEALINAILRKMFGINKARKEFMVEFFMLMLGMRGRCNFLNFSRYGSYSEQTYRNNFEKRFDYLTFNSHLIKEGCSNHLINAFDPSYIPKSGKQTEHTGMFWSGCAQKAKKGVEIGGFAVVDIDNNTALSLEAVQTPSPHELKGVCMTLVNHYAAVVIERKDVLLGFSKYLAVDGYFAKKEFVLPVTGQGGLEIISKFRNDANLFYVYSGKPAGGRGRPKTLDGKIDMKQIDKQKFKCCCQDDSVVVYEAVVYSKSLKRKVKLAYVELCEDGEPTGQYAVLFSTDLGLTGGLIYLYYKSRFQIEFLFRDAKQHAGLAHCQARGANKLHFHFNVSLSAVSVAKAAYYLTQPKEVRGPFSMGDVKTVFSNKIMADRIYSMLGIDLSCEKNRQVYLDTLWFGKIAA